MLRAIRQIIRRVSSHSKELSREMGLTLPQLLCLRAIGESEGEEVTVSTVAAEVQLSAPTVSRIIDRLERAQLVVRERRARDRRKVCLTLTPAGLERFQNLPVPLQERFLSRLGKLPAQKRMELLRSLQLVTELMDATDIDAAPMLAPELHIKE